MSLSLGIVGLPNVGKSTLFNALTKKQAADAANYPFCTIEPNTGIVTVPDDRLEALAKLVSPEKILPTTVEFVDIAGLVQGAAEGEGLGNKFLSHIREVNAIVHVVRAFENDDIKHVHDRIDPKNDIAIIETELALADLQTLEKRQHSFDKEYRTGKPTKDQERTKELHAQLHGLLSDGKPARSLDTTADDRELIKDLHLLTIKPVIYALNVSEEMLKDYDTSKQLLSPDIPAEQVIPFSAQIESDIAQLPDDEQVEYLSEFGLTQTGLDRIITAGYELLGLITFFTAGPQEVRAWTLRRGYLAPQAAGVIHTDFERGFIRAEVIAYQDFVDNKGEEGAKAVGKLRTEGKEYVVADGDVVHFRFSV